MDLRFQSSIHDWLNENGYKDSYDLISLAGCLRDFVLPINPEDKAEFVREIMLAVNLHNPDEVICFEHEECGGYAQDGTIPVSLSYEDDKSEHAKYTAKAKEDLVKLTGKSVSIKYVTKKGVVEDLISL